jgi:hypothetical protein
MESCMLAPRFIEEVEDEVTKSRDLLVYVHKSYMPAFLGERGHYQYAVVLVDMSVGVDKEKGPWIVGEAYRSKWLRSLEDIVVEYVRVAGFKPDFQELAA